LGHLTKKPGDLTNKHINEARDFFERPTLGFFSKKSGFDGLTNTFYAAFDPQTHQHK